MHMCQSVSHVSRRDRAIGGDRLPPQRSPPRIRNRHPHNVHRWAAGLVSRDDKPIDHKTSQHRYREARLDHWPEAQERDVPRWSQDGFPAPSCPAYVICHRIPLMSGSRSAAGHHHNFICVNTPRSELLRLFRVHKRSARDVSTAAWRVIDRGSTGAWRPTA